jgi:four helix bundle protein
MTNASGEQRPYDLEERTAKFGEAAIDFAMSLKRSPVASPLISQFVRSATSVGANYCEADDAESKKISGTRSQLVAKKPVKPSIG